MKNRVLLIVLLLTIPLSKINSLESDIDNILNDIEDNGNILESIEDLSLEPININNSSRYELESIPFLNTYQVENLLEYIFDNKKLESIYELRLIDGFDEETIRLCEPFLYVGNVEKEKKSLKKIFKEAKHIITSKATTQFPRIKNNYLGSPYSAYLKYHFQHKNMTFGITMEKDNGEPFDWKYNHGFDFYSAHYGIKEFGCLKVFIVGDYKLNFGQGLVLHSNKTFGTNNDISLLSQHTDAITQYTSCSENSYLRGAATTFSINEKYFVTAFTSHTQYKKSENYHRTEKEIANKNNNPSYILGGNVNVNFKKIKLGFSGLYEFLSKKFCVGIDYKTHIYKFNISGEIAMDENFVFSTINTINYYATSYVSITALYRYYSPGFSSLLGNSYSTNKMENENGILIGTTITPKKFLKITALADCYSYNTDNGYNALLQTLVTPVKNHSVLLRYNYTNKNIIRHQFRAVYSGKIENLNIKSGVYGSIIDNRTGYLITQEMKYNLIRPDINLNAMISIFDIPDYDNRIYTYESDLPYSFNSNMYYKKGYKATFMINYNWHKKISVCFKTAYTYYYLDNENKTDIKIQISFKL